jgi:hypothetical protein
MKRYCHAADATFGFIFLVTAMICIGIVVATGVYQAWCRIQGLRGIPFKGLVFLLPYVAMAVMAFISRQHLLRGGLPGWCYASLLVANVAAFWLAFGWFRGPMHDLALLCGSHERWGCGVVNSDGTPYYLIRDATVPWFLFTPPAVATIAHWIWSQRRGEQSNRMDDPAFVTLDET